MAPGPIHLLKYLYLADLAYAKARTGELNEDGVLAYFRGEMSHASDRDR